MTVLVTNSDTPLAGAVATGLEAQHEVRRTRWAEPLEPGSATAALVQDVRAVVHFGCPRSDGDAGELLDHATRRTYNLLLAAAEAGVERCVFVSTLRLLAALPAHLAVTEKWRSRPPSGRSGAARLPPGGGGGQGGGPRPPAAGRNPAPGLPGSDRPPERPQRRARIGGDRLGRCGDRRGRGAAGRAGTVAGDTRAVATAWSPLPDAGGRAGAGVPRYDCIRR